MIMLHKHMMIHSKLWVNVPFIQTTNTQRLLKLTNPLFLSDCFYIFFKRCSAIGYIRRDWITFLSQCNAAREM